MYRDQIIAALESALDEKSETYQEILKQVVNLSEHIREIFCNDRLSESIKVVLENQEEFQAGTRFAFCNKSRIQYLGSEWVAIKLVARARDTGSATAAVDWLEKILDTEKANGYWIMALWGITLKECVSLSETIDLMPLNQIPGSKETDWLKKHPTDLHFESLTKLGTRTHHLGIPGSALIYRTTVDSIVVDLGSEEVSGDRLSLKEFHLLEEVMLALTVLEPYPITDAVSWFQFEDDDLNYVFESLNEIPSYTEINPLTRWNHDEFDVQVAQVIIQQYLNLAISTKKRIRIALKRLNQAMRRWNVGDQAVEVCIALETLLIDDRGDNTFKIGLRSALLLGGTIESRIYNRGVVAAVYSIRSSFVHSGECSEFVRVRLKKQEKETVSSIELTRQAIIMCAKVICRVLEMSELPNWSELELSGDV